MTGGQRPWSTRLAGRILGAGGERATSWAGSAKDTTGKRRSEMTVETRNATIGWVDLSTPDIEGARRFYAQLLGWELTTQRTDMGDYTVASAGDRGVAGMTPP
jgi:hypothetical protein